MTDKLISTLFHDFMASMGMSPKRCSSNEDYELVIDNEHPVLLRYDAQQEHVILMGMLKTDAIPPADLPDFHKQVLDAALNPLRGSGPGVGIDQTSGMCFSYFTLPRHSVTVEIIRSKLAELVEWNKAFPLGA